MDRMGTPRGLIRYTTDHAVHGEQIRVVRPRVVVYACILVGVAATLVVSLVTRTPLILDVIRDRNALYREVRGDRIENAYTLRLINLDDAPHAYRLEVAGLDEAELVSPTGVIEAQPGEVSTIAARVQAPSSVAHGVHPITLSLAAVDAPNIAVQEKTRFLGPQP
jgi:polyferredoxin